MEETNKGWFDPIREAANGFFQTEKLAKDDILKHRKISQQVFVTSEVLVFTMGQNETWLDKQTSYFWVQIPPKDVIDRYPERFSPVKFSLEENSEYLGNAIEKLLLHNPKLKLILTVSPVGSTASFISNNVIVNSFAHKCHLRTLDTLMTEKYPENVFYFPSFEIVLAYNPYSYASDNRHVLNKTKRRIFSILTKSLIWKD